MHKQKWFQALSTILAGFVMTIMAAGMLPGYGLLTNSLKLPYSWLYGYPFCWLKVLSAKPMPDSFKYNILEGHYPVAVTWSAFALNWLCWCALIVLAWVLTQSLRRYFASRKTGRMQPQKARS